MTKEQTNMPSFLDQLKSANEEGKSYAKAQRQVKIDEEQRITNEKMQRHKFIKSLIDDTVDSMFPTQEQLLDYAKTHEENYFMIFQIKTDRLCIGGKKVTYQISFNPLIEVMSKDFTGQSSNIPYFDSTYYDRSSGYVEYHAPNINYIYERLKTKSIPELGTPRFDNINRILWYEW